jgi:hypothetical protein
MGKKKQEETMGAFRIALEAHQASCAEAAVPICFHALKRLKLVSISERFDADMPLAE